MKKLNAILLAAGVAFLAYLIWKTGAAVLWRELRSLGWGVAIFILCEGVGEMFHTVGWRYCLSGPCRSVSWPLLFRIRMAGYAINYLTPTAAMGGEVTRAALLSAKHPGPGAVSSVLIEKVCFAFGHVLFVAIGSLFLIWNIHLPRALWISMAISGTLVGCGVLTFMLLQKYGKLGGLIRRVATHRRVGEKVRRAAANITEVDDAMRAFYHERPLDLCLAVAWHLVGYSVGVFQTWYFFHLLGLDASLLMSAAIWCLGMWFDLLTFAVPMNVGSLEGSRIVAFKALGYTSLAALTYSVAFRSTQIFWSCVGLIFYASLVGGRSQIQKGPTTSRTASESSMDSYTRIPSNDQPTHSPFVICSMQPTRPAAYSSKEKT